VDPEALRSRLGKDRTLWVRPDDPLLETLENVRHGRSLWRTFLILAIVMLIIESVVGRTRVESIRGRYD